MQTEAPLLSVVNNLNELMAKNILGKPLNSKALLYLTCHGLV
jgi:hypothetical protein